MKIQSALLIGAISLLYACNNFMPGAFWAGFNKADLVKCKNDQGPWGGRVSIYWEAKHQPQFDEKDALAYAALHGWKLIKSTGISESRQTSWYSNGVPVFPNGMKDRKIYLFNTGMDCVEPGTKKTAPAYGFLFFSKDDKAMSVYFEWGE